MSLRKKRKERLNQNKEDQETLISCNYCNGNGSVVIADDGVKYRTKICCFCDGSGSLNHDLFKAVIRWKKILKANSKL